MPRTNPDLADPSDQHCTVDVYPVHNMVDPSPDGDSPLGGNITFNYDGEDSGALAINPAYLNLAPGLNPAANLAGAENLAENPAARSIIPAVRRIKMYNISYHTVRGLSTAQWKISANIGEFNRRLQNVQNGIAASRDSFGGQRIEARIMAKTATEAVQIY